MNSNDIGDDGDGDGGDDDDASSTDEIGCILTWVLADHTDETTDFVIALFQKFKAANYHKKVKNARPMWGCNEDNVMAVLETRNTVWRKAIFLFMFYVEPTLRTCCRQAIDPTRERRFDLFCEFVEDKVECMKRTPFMPHNIQLVFRVVVELCCVAWLVDDFPLELVIEHVRRRVKQQDEIDEERERNSKKTKSNIARRRRLAQQQQKQLSTTATVAAAAAAATPTATTTTTRNDEIEWTSSLAAEREQKHNERMHELHRSRKAKSTHHTATAKGVTHSGTLNLEESIYERERKRKHKQQQHSSGKRNRRHHHHHHHHHQQQK